ncbi:MAG: hypothetical protein V7K27_26285 [Nostoc sp.]
MTNAIITLFKIFVLLEAIASVFVQNTSPLVQNTSPKDSGCTAKTFPDYITRFFQMLEQ